jgi:hypothetical protein
MGGSGISSTCAADDNLLASGHCFGVYVHFVMWFALFHCCSRVFSFLLLFLFVFFYLVPQVLGEGLFSV